jgi:hypothetical protein
MSTNNKFVKIQYYFQCKKKAILTFNGYHKFIGNKYDGDFGEKYYKSLAYSHLICNVETPLKAHCKILSYVVLESDGTDYDDKIFPYDGPSYKEKGKSIFI